MVASSRTPHGGTGTPAALQGSEGRQLSRILLAVGWGILAVTMVGAIVVMATDTYGFLTGAVFMFVYPLLLLAASATATTGTRNGIWVALVGLLFELGCLCWLTMVAFDGPVAGAGCATVGSLWVCDSVDVSLLATYGGITLVAGGIGLGIGILLRRHLNRADPS